MKTQEFNVIDKTDGDADTTWGTVIIHDTVSGEPSVIVYREEIAEALETIAGPLPEDYERLPEEFAAAWRSGDPFGELSGLEAALGVSIEPFEDFLREHSGVWTAPGGRVVRDEPDWVYPDDVLHETQKN